MWVIDTPERPTKLGSALKPAWEEKQQQPKGKQLEASALDNPGIYSSWGFVIARLKAKFPSSFRSTCGGQRFRSRACPSRSPEHAWTRVDIARTAANEAAGYGGRVINQLLLARGSGCEHALRVCARPGWTKGPRCSAGASKPRTAKFGCVGLHPCQGVRESEKCGGIRCISRMSAV